MGFELYLQCVGASEHSGLSRLAVRSLFPVVDEESRPDYWRIRYDDTNSCHVGVTATPSDSGRLQSLHVERPCADLRLWEALMAVLRMGSVTIFWPGGRPAVADESVVASLPQNIIDSIGQPMLVQTAGDLLRAVQES